MILRVFAPRCCTQFDIDPFCRYGDTGNSVLAAGELTPIRRWWAPWDGIARITGAPHSPDEFTHFPIIHLPDQHIL